MIRLAVDSETATKRYPEGTRVEMVYMPDDPDPIPAGTQGTVIGGSGDQLWVRWDNGRSLNLLVGIDRFTVIEMGGGA